MLSRRNLLITSLAGALGAAAIASSPLPATAADRDVIEAKVSLAFRELYDSVPGSRELAGKAKGVLMMPDVTKGGFIVGGSYGEGALKINGQTADYYSVAAASLGLQAGLQSSKHAVFFLTDEALQKFQTTDGWEVGADAEATVLDSGASLGVDTTSYQNPVVAVVFGQSGILAGASIEGAKYSLIRR
jgi:lipid-binding SYLF domain-containing protein